MTRPLLKIQNLRKSFYGVHAVDGLSLEIQPNTITGIIGPNGSGKSTTIDCITGFQKIDAGEVIFDGVEIGNRAPHMIAQAGLIRTFQTVNVYDDMSLMQNLMQAMLPFDRANWLDDLLRTRRLREAEEAARQRADELIRLIGLQRYATAPASILSYGQKKLLALAAALMPKPRMVILDEPVAGVNPSRIREVEAVILQLHAAGETFAIIEHNVDFIMRICSHVIVLVGGKKLMEGDPRTVRRDPRVLEAYLGIRA